MSTSSAFEVQFQVRKASSGAGAADIYRRDARSAIVQAASAHPKDILVPLTNNVTLGSGESIHVLSVKSVHLGTEGAVIWS